MITTKDIKPIPKSMIAIIKREDKKRYEKPCGNSRFYAYLTVWKGELAKVTVAVRHKYRKWYCKQVAVHTLRSDISYVKDLCFYRIAGYVVGWYDVGASEKEKFFEDSVWYENDTSLFDPYAPVVNLDFLKRFPEYKYCPYDKFQSTNILGCLRLYEQFPEAEYLLKSGLEFYATSKTILRIMQKDKSFHKWLMANKDEYMSRGWYYCTALVDAYKHNKSIKDVQAFEERKRTFSHDYYGKKIVKIIMRKGNRNGYKQLFDYLDKQQIKPSLYYDYVNACEYLELDLNNPLIRFPKDFKRWHDIRIDEAETVRLERERLEKKEKAKQLRKEKRELIKNFMRAAEKYLPMDGFSEENHYAVFIAKSPAELVKEGNALSHCVGRRGYDKKMAREETLIFFVRKFDDLHTPFVTLEYSIKQKKILQCYAYDNQTPDDKVIEFVNKKWLPHANQQLQKIAA